MRFTITQLGQMAARRKLDRRHQGKNSVVFRRDKS